MRTRIGIDYDSLFHTLPGRYLVMLPDNPDFTVVEISDSLCDLVEKRREDVLNKPFFEVFPKSGDKEGDAGAEALKESMRLSVELAKPDNVGIIRYDILGADGEFVRKLWKTTNYPIIKDGGVRGVILSTEDVTESFDNESYNQQRLEYLEHLVEVNSSKDEFISVASHQLRTPATAVKQYLGMVLGGMFGELNDVAKDLIERANESNERQIGIISDLLKVAQVDSGKLTPIKEKVSLDHLVREIVQDQTEMFKKRDQTVELNIPNHAVIAEIDGNIIRMVIENIIDNASKYTENGRRISIDLKQDDHSVYIIVTDEGVGIQKQMLGKMFEKFSRIDNPLSTKVGGTGLGLYWAKKSVELHGGTIIYEPARPRGSIFTITLPKQSEPADLEAFR